MDCCRQDGASPGNLEDRQLGRRSDRHRQGQWKTKAELSDRCSSPLAQLTDRDRWASTLTAPGYIVLTDGQRVQEMDSKTLTV